MANACDNRFSILHRLRKEAETFEEQPHRFNSLRLKLTASAVAGFDETGIRIKAQRLWLHSCSTSQHAYYEPRAKRGRAAMDDIGILPKFKGIAVHDFWKSYYHYGREHALCNAHLLRELTFVEERYKQAWAGELADLLLKMKAVKESAVAKGKLCLLQATLSRYRSHYEDLVQKGLKANPHQAPPKKKRCRDKKNRAWKSDRTL